MFCLCHKVTILLFDNCITNKTTSWIVAIKCPEPDNGTDVDRIGGDERMVGDIREYLCPYGMYDKTSRKSLVRRVCQGNLTWSGVPVVCVGKIKVSRLILNKGHKRMGETRSHWSEVDRTSKFHESFLLYRSRFEVSVTTLSEVMARWSLGSGVILPWSIASVV